MACSDSKEGADSDLDKYLPEADIVITTPFHPGYINADRIAKAPKLKLALTAGIGSDHVDLPAAAEHGVTVAEITGIFLHFVNSAVAVYTLLERCCSSGGFAPACDYTQPLLFAASRQLLSCAVPSISAIFSKCRCCSSALPAYLVRCFSAYPSTMLCRQVHYVPCQVHALLAYCCLSSR